MATESTPEQRRGRIIRNRLVDGAKCVLIGLLFLFVLERDRSLAIAVGIVTELVAIAFFVSAYRAWRGPRPPGPAEPYSALQESMTRLREEEASSRSPSQPR